MASISLDNVSFRYPSAEANTLTELNLQVSDGEAHALLGASGAGKTTLLNILSGLLVPTQGQVLFDGQDVSALPGRARNVAQVFQFPVLYESLSVAENLAFVLKNRGFSKAEIQPRLDFICNELELGDVLQRKPAALSLYQKQMVAVGKALMRPDVSLVLLDEPLTAVEPKIKWRLRQTLRRAQSDIGVTMIYVTHDQTEALTFADRVSILTEQGILQTGSPEQVYSEPAHEFVGHFVGSPGMNFVAAHSHNISDCERIGFRPEWASLEAGAPLQGAVTRLRVQGVQQGQRFGLVTVQTDEGEVSIRGAIPEQLDNGVQVGVRVHRYVGFSQQLKVSGSEIT